LLCAPTSKQILRGVARPRRGRSPLRRGILVAMGTVTEAIMTATAASTSESTPVISRLHSLDAEFLLLAEARAAAARELRIQAESEVK
jgi:hypothetical protein